MLSKQNPKHKMDLMSSDSKRKDVEDNEIILEMKSVRGPFATAEELSDRLGITRQQMNRRLNALRDNGIIARKMCGSGYGWWIRKKPN